MVIWVVDFVDHDNNDDEDSGDSSLPSIAIQSIDLGSTSDGEQ
jgi:hypothetical protein